MENLKALLSAIQAGKLDEADKLLESEMKTRTDAIIENGRAFIAKSIKA